MSAVHFNPQPKDPEFRCEALTRTARDQPCQNCFGYDGVVWAHSNRLNDGKGKSRKAHDCFGAWLCRRCHAWLDQASTGMDPTGLYECTRHGKIEMWTAAFKSTLLALWRHGLIGVKK